MNHVFIGRSGAHSVLTGDTGALRTSLVSLDPAPPGSRSSKLIEHLVVGLWVARQFLATLHRWQLLLLIPLRLG